MASRGRPRKEDRTTVAASYITVRLTPDEREALDKLVDMRRGELDEANVSASSFLRGLLRREAIAKGVLFNRLLKEKPTRAR